jgi:pimeloyl-ACP methyl ester carboxylesterase
MKNSLMVRTVAAVVLLIVASNAQPARAQLSGNDSLHVTASFATPLARYYAPYALQAAAAYLPVKDFDDTRAAPDQSADVTLAVSPYASDPVIQGRARKFLQSWQYQFGSEGYLTCFESDPECQSALGADRWTFGISGGPTFQVWARKRASRAAPVACSEVSIAFRGTAGSFADWVSNFDPVTSGVTDDHYRQLRRNIDAIIKKITTLDCYKRAQRSPQGSPQIVSVGHSLGGGLAQFAALANKPTRPRIAKVFAFDPSPVTGAGLIDRQAMLQNAEGLEIDRIYQTGEVLQRLRRVYEQFPKSSSSCKPQVRTVVYDALQPTGAVVLHNMAGLAGQMVQLTYIGEGQLPFTPPVQTNCRTRYRVPATDQDAVPAPAPSGEVASGREAPGGPVFATQFNLAAPFGAAYAYAPEQERPVAKPVRARAHHHAAKKAGGHKTKKTVRTAGI